MSRHKKSSTTIESDLRLENELFSERNSPYKDRMDLTVEGETYTNSSKYDLPFSTNGSTFQKSSLLVDLVKHNDTIAKQRSNKKTVSLVDHFSTTQNALFEFTPNQQDISILADESSPIEDSDFRPPQITLNNQDFPIKGNFTDFEYLEHPRVRTVSNENKESFILIKELKRQVDTSNKNLSELMSKINILEIKLEHSYLIMENYEINQLEYEKKIQQMHHENDILRFNACECQKFIEKHASLLEDMNSRLDLQSIEKENMKSSHMDFEKQQELALEQLSTIKEIEHREVQNRIFNIESHLNNEMEKLRTDLKLGLKLIDIKNKSTQDRDRLQQTGPVNYNTKRISDENSDYYTFSIRVVFVGILLIFFIIAYNFPIKFLPNYPIS